MSAIAMGNSTSSGLEGVGAVTGVDVFNPSGSYNGSSSSSSVWCVSGSSAWLLASVLSLIILMTACGNVLLITLVFTQRSLRCTSNCFLVSLFLSDLMVALVVMPPAMLHVLCGDWVLWPGFCPVWQCFDVMCCSASILNLCVISLDRYLFIISPLRYKQRMTAPRALLLVGGAWGLAALASFLSIKMNWHSLGQSAASTNISTPLELRTLYPESYFRELVSTSGRLSFQCRLNVTLPFAVVASVLTFLLPSSAICFTYCRILLAARRQARRVAALSHPPYPYHSPREPSRPPTPGGMAVHGDDYSHPEPPVSRNVPLSVNSERRLAHRHGRRALKASLTLGVLLGLFFGAWLPFFITNMAQAFNDPVILNPHLRPSLVSHKNVADIRLERYAFSFLFALNMAVCPRCVPPALFEALTWLGYCNSTMNPIIYPLFMRDFKRAFGRLLPCCPSHSPRRLTPLSLSLRNSGDPNLATESPSLATEPPSLASDPPQPPATATDAVNLFDAEHAGMELPLLLPNQVDTLD